MRLLASALMSVVEVVLPARLSAADLGIVAVYLVGITLFGLRFRERGVKDRSLRSYFLAGNTIPWWAIALSIVSAETSTLTIISIPGVAFAGDLGFLQVVMGYMVGRVVVALLFLPRYFEGEMLTAYQLIEQRFGKVLYKVTAGLFLLTRAAAEGVRVFAVSIVVGIAIGTGDVLSIGIISALTLLYTFEGGMAAVIWTDVVQMGIYVAGTVVAMWTLGAHVPGGWGAIHAAGAAAGKFRVLDFAWGLGKAYTFWAGVLGGTFLTMASHGTDQLMVQRMLAARNLRESRLALLSSGVVIFLQFTLFLLIGVGLWMFYGQHPQHFASGDRIFPSFIVQQMPRGVAGLLVAAILAAAMSNLSAALNSLSSTTVVDFWMGWRPTAGDRERGLVSRGSTVVWAVVLFGIAVYSVGAGGKGHVVEIGLSIASVAYGAMLGVFLLGTLNRRATEAGAVLGMVGGFLLNVLMFQHPLPIRLGVVTIPHVAFTWYVLIGSGVTFLVGSLASLVIGRQRRAMGAGVALVLLIGAGRMSLGQGDVGPAAPGSVKSSDFTGVDRLIEDAVTAKKLPGAVLLVGHAGKMVYEQAYGDRAVEPRVEPMTVDTIFDMASMTKCLVTATAVMQLWEQGKVGLDEPVVTYLPGFGGNGKEAVTVRELLTHYSGLPPDVVLTDAWSGKEAGIQRAMVSGLEAAPGTTFKYSDVGFITLGALVERMSGERLEVYATEHIFRPLGMTETRYLPPPALAGGIAPTAHNDDKPMDDDRLLRGEVHDPTTRRMGGVAGHAGVFSTAHDTGVFAQALLDRLAGRPSKFPLKQATLEVMTTPEQPGHSPADLAHPGPAGVYPSRKGHEVRGLGWDIDSSFSRPRGEVFPVGSFGHTGFTGTSLWMDPGSDTYVVLLANAIHPRGRATISPLRGQVATAVGRALELYPGKCPEHTICDPSVSAVGGEIEYDKSSHTGGEVVHGPSADGEEQKSSVLTGLDVLEKTKFAALKEMAARHDGKLRLGLLTNQTGLDRVGHRTIDVLAVQAAKAVPGLELLMLFSPEHGIAGVKDSTDVANSVDASTMLPVVSLYGAKDADRRPKMEDLAKLDAVVIDLQDAGVRFYTYEAVTGYFVEACAKAGVELVVLDRPALVGGVAVQGPVSDAGAESYTDYMPMPVRNGMTLAELARYVNGEKKLGAKLTAVPMEGWRRANFFDDTGVPWVNPSPNLRSEMAAVLYPGVGLVEQTNVSVGRGTETPFEVLGAAWIDGGELEGFLEGRRIPGMLFEKTRFAVAEDANRYPFHGQTIEGVRLTATDRAVLNSPELGVELLAALHHLYPSQFQMAKAKTLVAHAATMEQLEGRTDPRRIADGWRPGVEAFRGRRAQYLLYP